MQVDKALSQGIYSFTLANYAVYKKQIKYFISDATVNKTWLFKGELLDYLRNMEYKNILNS